MDSLQRNRGKIINDPVYGFISFPSDLHFAIIEHPWFQRLRRIRQLGLTSFVYPGANHTRFQHALGAGYLMTQAIEVIRSKGHEITPEESEAAITAILLHDIGHGPFSHSLENSIIEGNSHEELSMLFMEELNVEFEGRLSLCLEIFRGEYSKTFLHQLISGQLDVDRLDYLKRDSFFTGVTEGVIGSDRIIKMLNVRNDQLVVDKKGIYSIEKFLIARRLMYWQVYYHKTVISVENLLIKILRRARQLSLEGEKLFGTPALIFFLQNQGEPAIFNTAEKGRMLGRFASLDDNDILSAAKVWSEHKDRVLSRLCSNLLNRKLFRVEIATTPFDEGKVRSKLEQIMNKYSMTPEEASFFLNHGEIYNQAYDDWDDKIKILQKSGEILDLEQATDLMNFMNISSRVKKHFLCYPKDL